MNKELIEKSGELTNKQKIRNEIEARFPEVRDKLNEDDSEWALMRRLVDWLRDLSGEINLAISADIVERIRRFKLWCEEQPQTDVNRSIWMAFIRGFWDDLFESNSTLVLIPQLLPRGEVTNEEILHLEKLFADMRNDLTVLTSTTDLEKLIPLVHEKAEHMIGSYHRSATEAPWPNPRRRYWPNAFMSIQDLSRFQNALAIMIALAEMAERYPDDYKAKLIEAVAKNAPVVDAILDKVAQVIRAVRATN